jgi:parallel beta-helix repeat protein
VASGDGIFLDHQSNVTIKNLNIDAGLSSYGIRLYYSSNITIFDCNIYLSGTGISVDHSSYNEIYRNRIERNRGGIYVTGLNYAHHNLVHNNTIASNDGDGISLGDSRNSVYWNNITDNAVGISVTGDFHNVYENSVTLNKRGNGFGIDVSSGGGGCNVSYNYVAENKIGFFLSPGGPSCVPNTLKGNTIVNNSVLNFGIYGDGGAGDEVARLYNDMDTSNTVNGKPIYYWINRENDAVPSEAGFVALINCRNITVANLTLEKNLEGVLLSFSNNSTISGNNLINNGEQLVWGGGNIVFYRSTGNRIYNNNIATDHWTGHGIKLGTYSSSNTIFENNFTKNAVGIWVTGQSNFNNISKNNMINNRQGIRISETSTNNTVYDNDIIGPGTYGIYLGAQYNTVSENNIIYNEHGLYVTAKNNTVTANNIMDNWVRGIYVDGSFNTFIENNIVNNNEGVYIYSYGQNNLFFYNNFVDNTKHVNYYWSGIGNSWNSSFPVGGNYWSGYEDKYPNAKELDNSGLWDTPYVINENNIDYYPLMTPTKPITRKFTAYDNIKVEICSNSSISEFQFNTATKTLSFNVTGSSGKGGFCNIIIPENLMWGDFSLFINGEQLEEGVNYTKTYNGTHYMFYVKYTHSEHVIEVISTEVVPEFSHAVIPLLLMSITMLAAALTKKRIFGRQDF